LTWSMTTIVPVNQGTRVNITVSTVSLFLWHEFQYYSIGMLFGFVISWTSVCWKPSKSVSLMYILIWLHKASLCRIFTNKYNVKIVCNLFLSYELLSKLHTDTLTL
jgi:hypothetical protein